MNSKKSVIITGGGTSERIDDVRCITNISTGRLAVRIANEYLLQDEVAEVLLLLGAGSDKRALASSDKLQLIEIGSSADLLRELETRLSASKVDVIVHSAAVSDYTIRTVMSADDFVQVYSEGGSLPEMVKNGKISSAMDQPVMVLQPVAKIISKLRSLAGGAKIVGFKLLSDAKEDELIGVSRELLAKNDIDFVLANDLSEIGEGKHRGYLISGSKDVKIFDTKTEIARGIVEATL